jgi:hypothetical protein
MVWPFLLEARRFFLQPPIDLPGRRQREFALQLQSGAAFCLKREFKTT